LTNTTPWYHPRSPCGAFIEWTVHDKLRHARLLGLREDKAARLKRL